MDKFKEEMFEALFYLNMLMHAARQNSIGGIIRMKNIEKYYDELLNQDYGDLDCYFTEHIMKEECCSKENCAECNKALIRWLNEEYREPIRLTQLEFDLLLVTKEYNRTLGELINNIYFEKLQEKGYFKNVDLNMTAREVLEKCEVIEE